MTKARTIAKALWETGQRLAPDHGIAPVRVPWEDSGVDTRRWMEHTVADLLERGIIR